MGTTQKLMSHQAEQIDARLGAAKFLRVQGKKVFPDHWSFLLGEIALYAFIILILTGIFLTLFFNPSMEEVVYHGTYTKLDGVKMSQAYQSTLRISFDIRGGLLMRQIHHWAANIFLAAIIIHLLRNFFTGAFRKPREINWSIGLVLFILAVVEGFAGYSLPDDLLSGTGLRIANAIFLSIPVVGTYLSFFIWGGQFPGTDFVPRLYVVHILLIPGILLALIGAHLMILWHQKHTQFPLPGRTEHNVVGTVMYPNFMAQTAGFFFLVFGACAFLGTFAQINPVWMYGPYTPANVSAGSQPDWYLGFLEGSMRIMPRVSSSTFGHTWAWNIFIPAVVYPTIFLIIGFAYPFLEQWATGDKRQHQLLDRPRNAPTRTAFGVAGMWTYGNTWAAGANDIIADTFHISLNATTWFFRISFFVGPILAFIVTRRVCLGLQHSDKGTLEEGFETGIIQRLPSGAFIEVTRPAPEEERSMLASKKPLQRITPLGLDEHGVAPRRRALRRAQAMLNRAYTADDVEVAPEEDGERAREREERKELTTPE